MKRNRIIALTFAVLFLMPWHGRGSLCADGVSIEASLDRSTCLLGDNVILTVRIAGVQDAPEPLIPPIEGVDVQPQGSSRESRLSTSNVNGRMKVIPNVNVIYLYSLTARSPGQFTIPAIAFTTDKGEKFNTAPLTFTVVAGAKQDLVILEIVPNKTDVYWNEAFQITVKVYIHEAGRLVREGYDLNVGCLREIPGCVRAEEEDRDDKLKPAGDLTRGGKTYQVYTSSKIFFPLRDGEVLIPPATMKCQYLKKFIPGRRSVFDDPFFDDAFGARVRAQDLQTIFARSNEVKINVRPLPAEGRPDGFGRAVGQFRMSASLSTDKATVGEPIELTTTISGAGNPDAIDPPRLADKSGFKVYEWEAGTTAARASNKMSVTRSFKTIIEPQTTDVKAVPQIVFCYFDPEEAKYVTLREGPLPITVSAPVAQGLPATATPGAAPFRVAPQILQEDIRPIVTSTTDLQDQSRLIYHEPLFLALLVAPLLLASACALIQRRRERLRTDEAFARGKRAMRMAKKRLAEAKRALSADSSKEFYALLFKAVTEYIGDKLNLPPAAVTSQAVPDLLGERNVDAKIIAQTAECLWECEHGRFSAEAKKDGSHSLRATAALLKKLERVIR